MPRRITLLFVEVMSWVGWGLRKINSMITDAMKDYFIICLDVLGGIGTEKRSREAVIFRMR